ncbi:hypothetical protein TEQG_06465 [Trichophyton equinum CBS 127.97]|uniref:Uncharacterized protein n=1 Tax=Trichophyton equinum (strain ATCC MYA-4606 / CBS 127.97) TaxID=559882 RepID=F2Q083_TRIEC|nr:hypothetical protein TEQG_06465 [Trichophyton equinum CBS 127.97]
MLNDTGSDLLIVFDTDLIILGIPPTYMGFGPPIGIVTAGGSVRVEIQLLNFQSEPIPGWTFEEAVVVLSSEGAVRLSGNGMRQCLYFATAPGNTQLYVSQKKKWDCPAASSSLVYSQIA